MADVVLNTGDTAWVLASHSIGVIDDTWSCSFLWRYGQSKKCFKYDVNVNDNNWHRECPMGDLWI